MNALYNWKGSKINVILKNVEYTFGGVKYPVYPTMYGDSTYYAARTKATAEKPDSNYTFNVKDESGNLADPTTAYYYRWDNKPTGQPNSTTKFQAGYTYGGENGSWEIAAASWYQINTMNHMIPGNFGGETYLPYVDNGPKELRFSADPKFRGRVIMGGAWADATRILTSDVLDNFLRSVMGYLWPRDQVNKIQIGADDYILVSEYDMYNGLTFGAYNDAILLSNCLNAITAGGFTTSGRFVPTKVGDVTGAVQRLAPKGY
jgi:hypothetical protein